MDQNYFSVLYLSLCIPKGGKGHVISQSHAHAALMGFMAQLLWYIGLCVLTEIISFYFKVFSRTEAFSSLILLWTVLLGPQGPFQKRPSNRVTAMERLRQRQGQRIEGRRQFVDESPTT